MLVLGRAVLSVHALRVTTIIRGRSIRTNLPDPVEAETEAGQEQIQCAIDRAILAAGLQGFGEARNKGGPQLLKSNAFTEHGM
ncbi:MAG: hypothetical protein GWN99_02635 [Gemmatimonadetes bacterium]|uniref:Uncharacterized protein n=1 Tax=Candidatus Kutchimonas denitrificans TaxID=3056748 RepID=A0AAE5CAR6_9BACT|nr:hypothetical protein [Gemmatimonadota bacterium]NIR74852.1 hypothetical protein [Candidatus Kutchimonas denitrificans]NIR99963.1 hypothetical protein [Gemmatimonadota bacterium]NIT65547.1 hypothetical protein [Gemmatimonadota bacterium]NIU52517.1 hypothetical protein [Gemmatimonadota bacterium]